MGLSKKMLAQVEVIAIENDCCKMTLEVLSGNRVAMNAYKKVGFEGIESDEQTDQYLFWQKKLA